ncbi:LOW QUALITY PROTEIN: regulator of G-protein signaling 13-like [Podargus strigoides]
MSPNTCWLCKIFRAEENGISTKDMAKCLLQVLSCHQPQWKPTIATALVGMSHWGKEMLPSNTPANRYQILHDWPMIYKTYLKTEYSDEREFCLACEAYKKVTSQRKRISMARKLFTSYIQSQAPKEINIDRPARKAIIRNIQEPTQSCFDEAQRVIYMHMEMDSYPFLESKSYQNLKHSLETNDNISMVN